MGCGITKESRIERENHKLSSHGVPTSNKKIIDSVIRREINDLSEAELERFVEAIKTMMRNDEKPGTSIFFKIAGKPGWPDYHYTSGIDTFPMWHRLLLVEFEQELKKADKLNGLDGNIGLPYWDWATKGVPPQLLKLYDNFPRTFFPENDPNTEEFKASMFNKRRHMAEIMKYIHASKAPEMAQYALNTTEYWKYASTRWRGLGPSIEAANNAVHMACGFPMSNMKYAAFDILYWLHHCNVDRHLTKYLHDNYDAYQEFYNSQKIMSELNDEKNLANLPIEPFRHPQSNKRVMPRDCFEDSKTLGYIYDSLPVRHQIKHKEQHPYLALFEGILMQNLKGKSFLLHVFATQNDDEAFQLPYERDMIFDSQNYVGCTPILSGQTQDTQKLINMKPFNCAIDITEIVERLNIPSSKISIKVICEDEFGELFKAEDVSGIPIPRLIGPFFDNNESQLTQENPRENFNLQKYLETLGYYAGTKDGHYGEMTIQAVKTFQKSYGIHADGLVGPQTKNLILKPRNDFIPDINPTSSKVGKVLSKFPHKDIKFFVGVQPGYIQREQLTDEIEQSIKMWDNQYHKAFTGKVTQVLKESKANVKIFFDDLSIKNMVNYDGIEGNLAIVDKDTVTFDLSQKWLTKDMNPELKAYRFQEVFLHVFGHVLGLEHVMIPGNIMYPYYQEGLRTLGTQDLHSFNVLYELKNELQQSSLRNSSSSNSRSHVQNSQAYYNNNTGGKSYIEMNNQAHINNGQHGRVHNEVEPINNQGTYHSNPPQHHGQQQQPLQSQPHQEQHMNPIQSKLGQPHGQQQINPMQSQPHDHHEQHGIMKNHGQGEEFVQHDAPRKHEKLHDNDQHYVQNQPIQTETHYVQPNEKTNWKNNEANQEIPYNGPGQEQHKNLKQGQMPQQKELHRMEEPTYFDEGQNVEPQHQQQQQQI